MFGKGKRNPSSNDRFLMAAGRKAGNLPPPATRSIKPDAPAGAGKSAAASRHAAPKAAPTVLVKKGIMNADPSPVYAQRTINRAQVRFPTQKLAGKTGPVQGGRKA